MISLFLDTSSNKLVIYLVKDNDVLYEKTLETKNDHASYVVSFIDEALNKNNLETKDINKIYIVNGPGSFTGTRIGVTIGKTMAYSNNIGVIPVSSLKQYIFDYDGYDYYVSILKEKGNKVYYGIYDSKYNTIVDDKYSLLDDMLLKLMNYKGKIAVISNETIEGLKVKPQIININKLMDYYKDDEIVSHLLKPNYLKKIEAEDKL